MLYSKYSAWRALGKINPFVNRTFSRVSPWVHPTRSRLSDPSTPKLTSCANSTPTGRLGRGPDIRIPLPLHPPLLPGRPGGAGFLAARLGRGRPRFFLGDLVISSDPLSAPLPGLPSPSVGWRLLPRVQPAQHHQPSRHPHSRAARPASAVGRSTPTRSLSLPGSHLDAGLRTAPAAAAGFCSSRSPGESKSAREGGRRRVSLLSPPVCSSPPLRSPPLRSAAVARRPRPSRASGPSRQPKGATRYPGNRPVDHSRPLPAPSHARLQAGPPASFLSPRPRPPTVTGIPGRDGGWGKRRGFCEETGPVRQAGPGGGASTSRRRGRKMGQDTGRLQRRSRVGFRENGPCRKEQQKLALEGSKKGPWKGRSGDRKGNSKGQERLGRRARVNTGWPMPRMRGRCSFHSLPRCSVLGLGLPSLSAAASTHHGLRDVTRAGRDAAGG